MRVTGRASDGCLRSFRFPACQLAVGVSDTRQRPLPHCVPAPILSYGIAVLAVLPVFTVVVVTSGAGVSIRAAHTAPDRLAVQNAVSLLSIGNLFLLLTD